MISREFVYEFSIFDDISARENDKKSHAIGFFANFEGVLCKFGAISCQKVGCADLYARGSEIVAAGGFPNKSPRQPLVDINQPLRLREGGVSICSENSTKYKLGK